MAEWDPADAAEYFPEPGDLEELGAFGAGGGSAADARRAGDDGVEALDKVTAQLAGASTGPSSRRCAAPWLRRS